MKMKRFFLAVLLSLSVLSMTACKPRYKTRLEDPNQTVAADAVINLDFDQLHNDAIENYQDDDRFAFIKDLDISGSNDPKEINISLTVVEDTSDVAIEIFMSDLLRQISLAATVQDSRYTAPSSESFGSLYDSYSVHYSIVRGEETVEDTTVSAGESFSYSPAVDISMIE